MSQHMTKLNSLIKSALAILDLSSHLTYKASGRIAETCRIF